DARAQLHLGIPHLGQQHDRIEGAIEFAQTLLDRRAQLRMRQRPSIGRGRSMIAFDYLSAFPPLVLQLEGWLEESSYAAEKPHTDEPTRGPYRSLRSGRSRQGAARPRHSSARRRPD